MSIRNMGIEEPILSFDAAGLDIKEKKVERLWGILGFKSLLPRKNLSQANPKHSVYPHLLEGMIIDHPRQVFSSDITFIPLVSSFVYLTMVMDWYSRYILSWELSNCMSVHFCLEALEKALEKGVPEYFNTDQGSQFTSCAYLTCLLQHMIKISMDSQGRAVDNVYIERAWWSLKYERIYLRPPSTMKELLKEIASYVQHYNTSRPHQSLCYATPEEVYFGLKPKLAKGEYHGFKVKTVKRGY